MAKVKNPFIEALAKVAESQDISSFKKIFDYFSPRLKSFLMRSGADEAIAEEIIQETMTIIWTKADYYDPKVASPSTWIYTIARNKKIEEENSLSGIKELSKNHIETLEKNDINNKEDLADLSVDELLEMIELSKEDAGKIIMDAREPWFNQD